MERVDRVLVGVALIAAAGLMMATSAANRVAVPAVRDESVFAAARIDLNTATRVELCTLPGVGEATARKILEYRELSGGFLTIEQIMEVDGIGEKKYEAMKELITVEDTDP